jgi:hypothetical protein
LKKYIIVQSGEYRGLRCYDESIISPISAFYSELEVYFNNWLNEGYFIYTVYNESNGNVKLDENDIKWLQILDKFDMLDSDVPDNIRYIKKNQYRDYKLVCCAKDIDFLFLIPLKNDQDYYYYNFIVVTKNEKIIFDIISYNFNLINFKSLQKINSLNINEMFLTGLFQIYDLNDGKKVSTIFKDVHFTKKESDYWISFHGSDFPKNYYIEKMLSLICLYFYFDNSYVFNNLPLNRMSFCTNFLDLVGGVVAKPNNDGVIIETTPMPTGFLDLISDNDEILPVSWWDIRKFHWTLEDYEGDYIKFLEERSRWNELDISCLEQRKAKRKK